MKKKPYDCMWDDLYPWDQTMIEEFVIEAHRNGNPKTCTYCGILYSDDKSSYRQKTKDHVWPLCRGGPDDYYVWACQRCNHNKGNSIRIPIAIIENRTDELKHLARKLPDKKERRLSSDKR